MNSCGKRVFSTNFAIHNCNRKTCQAAADYQTEFDKILKSGKNMKDVFSGINDTIDGLIR